MGVLDELKAEEAKLRGIRADGREGAGHNFGKSALSKRIRGESGNAPTDSKQHK